MHNWKVFRDFDTAAKAAADFLATNIATCVAQQAECHVVLPGGNTPTGCLGYLAGKELPWDRVHWYPGDERCYPPNHPDRNSVMLKKKFWNKIGNKNIHLIHAELGAEAAAAEFCDEIGPIKKFDIAFLGMGEDGHTASLFPDNKALHDTRTVVPVFDAPKPPPERVSLSLTALSNIPCKLILVGGAAKAGIIERIKAGQALPVNRIGDVNWYLDEAASIMTS